MVKTDHGVFGEQEGLELDEGQQRMTDAAESIFEIPAVYAKLHEFDDRCQPDEALRM